MERIKVKLRKSTFAFNAPSKVIHFTGPNGSGKTELLRAITDSLAMEDDYLVDYIESSNTPILETQFNWVFRRAGLYLEELPDEKIGKIKEVIGCILEGSTKTISKFGREITFWYYGEEIGLFELSNGEKRLFLILLSVILQNERPAYLIIDEPETSLHITIQRKLLKTIFELNPNVKILTATNSPSIVKCLNVEEVNVDKGWYKDINVWRIDNIEDLY